MQSRFERVVALVLCPRRNHVFIHSSIRHLVAVVFLELIPAASGWTAGCTLERSPGHHTITSLGALFFLQHEFPVCPLRSLQSLPYFAIRSCQGSAAFSRKQVNYAVSVLVQALVLASVVFKASLSDLCLNEVKFRSKSSVIDPVAMSLPSLFSLKKWQLP